MHELRHAFRQLARTPGFTALAVLTLALGIGACTTMFSLVNAVLLRPLPFREPGRLAWIQNNMRGGTLSHQTLRVDNFLDWRAQASSFEALAAYNAFFDLKRYSLASGGETQRLRGIQVSQNFLEVLGIHPALGRSFTDEECAWNGRKAAILSHAFWLQKFGGAADIVGRSVMVDGEPVNVVGVLPQSANLEVLFSPGTPIELLLPFPLTPETARQGNTLFAIGRLKSGVSLSQAGEELAVIDERLRTQHPERGALKAGSQVAGLEERIRGPFRPAFLILSGAVLCVLLIACVNLSNLLLARANTRRREYSVRIALGASRWRLLRQTMTESLLLALAGCALGLLGASAGTVFLSGTEAFGIPLLQTSSVDAKALAVSAGLTLVAGLFCGALPSVQLWRRKGCDALVESGSRSGAGRESARMRQTLVIAEIALACVLLVGAGLLLRSFVAVLQADLGFQPDRLVSWRLDTPRRFDSPSERVLFYDRVVERVAALPGIEAVGLNDTVPLGWKRSWSFVLKGEIPSPQTLRNAFVRIVDQRCLQAMRVPLREGRYFDDKDQENSPKVIVVGETMARKLWPGQNPIGQTLILSGRVEYSVVGVVGDVLHGLEEGPQPDMYLNFRQSDNWAHPELVVRSKNASASFIPDVRTAIREIDPSLASNEFAPLNQIVDQAIAPRRLVTGILGLFSTLALLLAAVGLYGVIVYSVGQRTQEIGIRIAVGAQRGDVLRLVVGEGLRLTAFGLATGLAAALLATRVLQSQLHGVGADDPFTYLLIAALIALVALLASWLPARRALRIDPITALRSE